MAGPYDDILYRSRPVSAAHPPMSRMDRAAQFAPFAALTGYEAAVRETARLTAGRMELSEDEKQSINRVLVYLQAHCAQQPPVTAVYFLPDQKKDGGAYVTAKGALRRMDLTARCLLLTDGTQIPIDDIAQLHCSDFPEQAMEP